MRFLTEKQFRAIHEGHASEVEYLNADLNVVRSERDYYREARARANDSAGLLRADLVKVDRERKNFIEAFERAQDLAYERRGIITNLQGEVKSLAFAADAYRLERNAARAERETLRKELAEEKKFRVAFRAEAVTLRNERDEARAELAKLKAAYSVRPMGLGEMIADTLAKQADAALDSLDESGPKSWERSDCIIGESGCFCNSEVV